MRLMVHLGFHKTASTFFQNLLNDHHGPLRERGIYYQHQPDYPAHRATAWALMRGETGPLETMLADARDGGCHTVFLSAEDLEAAICTPLPARALERAAARGGVGEIEWHLTVREPGAYFASLFAQLQHHCYADALSLFYEVMRKGYVFMHDPEPALDLPYWYYCFDYHRLIGAFAAATPHPVIVHDYADDEPYPNWRMADRMGVLELLSVLPREERRNRRLDERAVLRGYRDRLAEVLPGWADYLVAGPAIEAALQASGAAIDDYAAMVGRRYGPSWRAALEAFGSAARPIELA